MSDLEDVGEKKLDDIEILHEVLNSEVGVCVKNLSKIVQYQNSACLARCGNRVGQECTIGCMKENASLMKGYIRKGITQATSNKSEVGPNGAENYETVVICDGRQLTSIQCPTNYSFDDVKKQFEVFELTDTELKIVHLRLMKKSNRQIYKSMFISKATLKTHWNNIYKKISPQLALWLQGQVTKSSNLLS